MTVRISFFAVDLHPFEQFLAQSLGETLKFVAENRDEDGHVFFSMDIGRYLASSRFGILDGTGDRHYQGYVEMSTADIDTDPNLSVPCRDHLATRGYTTELYLLLDVLAGCSTVPWVHELRGQAYKRWWIGSLLDWVQRANVLSEDDYVDYEILFLKVLRGHPCGAPLSGLQVWLSDLDFPIIPRFDNGGGAWGFGQRRMSASSCGVPGTCFRSTPSSARRRFGDRRPRRLPTRLSGMTGCMRC
jgi:hypothetical protein